MRKQEFLRELWKRLSELPQQDVERSLDYYSEMIDERIEGGLSEEEAVEAVGTVEDAARQILSDMPERERVVKVVSASETKAEEKPEQDSNKEKPADRAQNMYTSAGRTDTGYAAGYAAGYSAPKKSSGGKIALLIITFPIWFSLLISAGAIVFSIFVTLWAVALSLYVVAFSFVVSCIAGVILLVILALHGQIALGLFYLGVGFILGGIGIFIFMITNSVIKGTAVVSGKLWRGVTSVFRKKEAA